jgi:hypothetical protein
MVTKSKRKFFGKSEVYEVAWAQNLADHFSVVGHRCYKKYDSLFQAISISNIPNNMMFMNIIYLLSESYTAVL